ncbi:MAG: sugar kinase [Desertifilum sp.]|nr:sugar kinase [Desertifilum sp.]
MDRGLFIGLITLDFLYLAEGVPASNQKIVAQDYLVAAGGPATNAAVTFSYLGNPAKLLGVIGSHPIGNLILSDLQAFEIEILELDPTRSEPPPVSSIIVSRGSGNRAVISINASKSQIPEYAFSPDFFQDIAIVLIDGHQMAVSHQAAQLAKTQNIPIVIDGGSWKPGFEKILPLADYAIASANFHPPGCQTPEDVMAYLVNLGIPHLAITHGKHPILYYNQGESGQLEIPPISAVDTLGAGDIFHGAFCHSILQQPFLEALQSAANIASQSCTTFGTRHWMKK